MKNSLNREIPDELLKDGIEVFQGAYARENYEYKKDAPTVKANVASGDSKLVDSIKAAIEQAGLKDGMTISFHHHLRNGDYVCAKVMDVIHEMGIKDLFVCASSLGKAHANMVPMIEDGTVTGISTSGVRDEIGEALSMGKLKHPAWIRTHGGRVRAIETGQVHIDVAFIAASSSDVLGNASGKNGRHDCGVLSYADVDAKYADKVVVITDTINPVPNFPAPIQAVDVDYVVKIDQIGDPAKIASGALRLTKDVRELKMAENCAKVVANTPWFKEGFSFQTGAGGASLAVTQFLKPYMDERDIRMGWGMGGITEPMVQMFREGYIDKLINDQAFDIPSVESVYNDSNHFEISCSQYANPMNKGAFVNYLDYVILGALEVDTDFNVNVVQGSDGMIQGAPGGHPDTAAGAKCTIIVAPLIRSRLSTVRRQVTSVTTPGETVDVVVTDYGVAVNPARKDILEALEQTDLPLISIEELADIAESITGTPAPLEFEDKVVALIEYRDGTIIDVIKKPILK
ncbi:citrate lyase subunit alpha [Peptoniphilus equinus]|uniref:Citrate lyase alpha chain n=1 Tax=Peptoniphilus equinus TaxID=3016343 RepID=A0ABY7QUF7_9FIRM|nr:citrate lyase subunit alpha [Peptoniphilus equinus]WBW49660.1 citrate lyase subunit alpha [Peptoniphilus equinus]